MNNRTYDASALIAYERARLSAQADAARPNVYVPTVKHEWSATGLRPASYWIAWLVFAIGAMAIMCLVFELLRPAMFGVVDRTRGTVVLVPNAGPDDSTEKPLLIPVERQRQAAFIDRHPSGAGLSCSRSDIDERSPRCAS